MTLRPFEDLIKPMEIDGKTFVPIEEIAKLAVSPEVQAVTFGKHKINENIVHTVVKGHRNTKLGFSIAKNYSVYVYHLNVFLGNTDVYNQVQIVKNLIKWGFVEP